MWEVDVSLVEPWLDSLDDATAAQVLAASEILSEVGPNLDRPLVDTVSASRHRNMKELRPGSTGQSEIRVLFALDPQRKAVMLVAGDKAGSWKRWYTKNIALADELLDAHLERLGRR